MNKLVLVGALLLTASPAFSANKISRQAPDYNAAYIGLQDTFTKPNGNISPSALVSNQDSDQIDGANGKAYQCTTYFGNFTMYYTTAGTWRKLLDSASGGITKKKNEFGESEDQLNETSVRRSKDVVATCTVGGTCIDNSCVDQTDFTTWEVAEQKANTTDIALD